MTQPVSFFSDDLVEGGGPPIEQNLRIHSAIFVDDFNYGGSAPEVTALKLDFLTDKQELLTQHYSAGGSRIRSANGGRALTAIPTKNSNFGILMTAVTNAGFPKELLKLGDITVLNGLYAYWDGQTVNRVGMPGRDGAMQKVIAVPTKILSLPGEQPASTPSVAAPPAPTAPAPPAPIAPPPPAAQAPPVAAPPVAQAPPVAAPPVAQAPPVAAPPVAQAPPVAAPPVAEPPAPAAAPPVEPPAPAAAEAPAPPLVAPGIEPGQQDGPDVAINVAVISMSGQMDGAFSKQQLMMRTYDDYPNDPVKRDAICNFIFTPGCDKLLELSGYDVSGAQITHR